MRVLPLVAVCLFLGAGFSSAQTESRVGAPARLTQVFLSIENLPPTAKACGITENLIKDAFVTSASFSRLQITDDMRAPTFYIHVGTFQSSTGLCVSPTNYRLYIRQQAQPPFNELDLWIDGSIVQSKKSEHAQMVKEDVETYAKKFLTQWNLDKKPQ